MRNRQRPYWIPFDAPPDDFPPLDRALSYPNGLLALGGDLKPERLLSAYRRGIFPWYSEDQPILWWSPDPRMVMFPEHFEPSRSLRKSMRNKGFTVSLDHAFENVIRRCAETFRPDQFGTWITPEMRDAYITLHYLGHAHSVECWQRGRLVGGLYGMSLGRVFFGESMFSLVPDASKVAYARLIEKLLEWGYELIDCQVYTSHLESLGARMIPREDFQALLAVLCPGDNDQPGSWKNK